MRSCRSRRLVRRKGQAIYENREEVVITAHGLICFAADAQKARAGPVTRLKKAKHKKLKHNLILGMPTDDMHERKKLETELDRTWLVQRNQISQGAIYYYYYYCIISGAMKYQQLAICTLAEK
jgi:hypothetical protein